MYKIFVVDDEFYAREGIAEFIDNFDNCEMAGQADNGLTAFEKLKKTKADILIADMKMPKMDGLSLVKKLRKNGNNIKVIFMSAYSDIEFIKMALKVDAIDYILKPVNLDELTNVIKRVIKELDEEKQRMDYMLAVEKRLKQSISHLNKDFFVNLIEGNYKSVEEIKQKMEFLGLNLLEKTSFFVVSVRFEEYGAIISDMSQQAKKAFDFAVLNVLQEMIDGFANGYSFDIGEGDFVGIINVFENCTQNEIKSFRNELEIIIKKTFNTNVSIENGILVECIEELEKSYESAYKSMNNNNAVITKKIKQYIANHYMENITIKDISNELFLTSTYLCLIFKNEEGITINRYITQLRMDKAIDLLKNTNMTIAQIALQVGYTDTTYFSKLFKSYIGSNPREIRKEKANSD